MIAAVAEFVLRFVLPVVIGGMMAHISFTAGRTWEVRRNTRQLERDTRELEACTASVQFFAELAGRSGAVMMAWRRAAAAWRAAYERTMDPDAAAAAYAQAEATERAAGIHAAEGLERSGELHS